MHFKKEDMAGTHYRWCTEDEKKIFTGEPTRRSFDPFNGDQVLFLINFYASLAKGFTPEEGRKIEQKIAHRLPIDVKSEMSAFNWIRDNMLSCIE